MQQRLVEYHIWATERLLAAVQDLTNEQFERPVESSFPSIRETMVHLLVVDYLWLGRLGVNVDGVTEAEILALREPASLRPVWQHLAAALRQAAANLDPQCSVTGQTKSGGVFQNTVWEILHHVTNHASYHRGQVTTLLRQVGAKPSQPLDAIYYYRENPVM